MWNHFLSRRAFLSADLHQKPHHYHGFPPRAQMTSVGVLGRGDPRRCWDPLAPLSSCSPLQRPGLFLQRCHQSRDQDLSAKAPGWLPSCTLSLRPPVAADGCGELASPSPSFGASSQTRSTCSEATREWSEQTFCTFSVIRSKLFPSEQADTWYCSKDHCLWLSPSSLLSSVLFFLFFFLHYLNICWTHMTEWWEDVSQQFCVSLGSECVGFGFGGVFHHCDDSQTVLLYASGPTAGQQQVSNTRVTCSSSVSELSVDILYLSVGLPAAEGAALKPPPLPPSSHNLPPSSHILPPWRKPWSRFSSFIWGEFPTRRQTLTGICAIFDPNCHVVD